MNQTTTKPAADMTETPAEIKLPTWPESDEHEFGGYHHAPAEFAADMLATFARIFHDVHDLRERFRALPGSESIEPAGGIIDCLMHDANAAMIATIWTAEGFPTTQQDVFGCGEYREPASRTLDGWEFQVTSVVQYTRENGEHLYRWRMVADEVD